MTTTELPASFRTIEDVRRHVAECSQRADEFARQGVWIHRCAPSEIEVQLAHLSGLMVERRHLPLLGLTFAVKDNIDVANLPTTAACPAFAYTPQVSAVVVQRLCDAGAIVVGKTNLDQFATGLVGTRSPYGACENFYDRKYISGGSSSGSAVALAAGLCDFSLGTDTAGSGRVPAAFNNLVGLKPSRGLLSTTGVVPACRSLDCVSIFTRDCTTAERVLSVAEAFDPADIFSRSRCDITGVRPASARFRFGVPDSSDLEFFGNQDAAQLYASALNRLADIGGVQSDVDYGPFHETANLLYEGPWLAERLAAISDFYERHGDQILPVTRSIIGAAEKMSAVDAFRGIYQLAALRKAARKQWTGMDVLAIPTAGTIYTIDEVQRDPVKLNRNLGYYTNFVNLLDLCAIALPAGFLPNQLPFGITLVAPAGTEQMLLEIGAAYMNGDAR